jgi:hypothetical protein
LDFIALCKALVSDVGTDVGIDVGAKMGTGVGTDVGMRASKESGAKLQSIDFSSQEASDILHLSKSATHRLLKWAVSSGKLERLENTNRSFYRLLV